MLLDWKPLIYPQYCVSCAQPVQAHDAVVCLTCMHAVLSQEARLSLFSETQRKLHLLCGVQSVFTLGQFEQEGTLQKLLHQMKYEGQAKSARLAGKLLGKSIAMAGQHFDMIVPVPVSYRRWYVRGYNQAEQLAIGIGSVLQIPVQASLLGRSSKGSSQVKKDKEKRWALTHREFYLKDECPTGLRILLCDDVVTTGATIASCASLINSSNQISMAVVANV